MCSKVKWLIPELGKERCNMSLAYFVMQESMNELKKKKKDGGMSQGDRNQNKVTPTGQIRDNLSIKIVKNSNEL